MLLMIVALEMTRVLVTRLVLMLSLMLLMIVALEMTRVLATQLVLMLFVTRDGQGAKSTTLPFSFARSSHH
jgi:hypothetical protein